MSKFNKGDRVRLTSMYGDIEVGTEGTVSELIKDVHRPGSAKVVYDGHEHEGPLFTYPEEIELVTSAVDLVNHPPHYTTHPSGIECIQITEHMNFTLGNAVKYIWRAGLKNDEIEDLKKAAWYLNREIERRSSGK